MKFFKALLFASVAVASALERRIHDHDRSFHEGASVGTQHSGLEQVKEHHERRMAKLEELIEQRRQMVEDHENGHRKLNDEEYSHAAKQHQNFQGKLKQMQETNTDEDHLDRMGEIKALHERSMRMKFGEDGL